VAIIKWGNNVLLSTISSTTLARAPIQNNINCQHHPCHQHVALGFRSCYWTVANPDTPGIAGQGSDIRSSARPQKNLAVVGVAYLVLVESASGSDEHYHSKEVREANNSGPNAKASLNRAEFSLSIQCVPSMYNGSGIYRWQFTYQLPWFTL